MALLVLPPAARRLRLLLLRAGGGAAGADKDRRVRRRELLAAGPAAEEGREEKGDRKACRSGVVRLVHPLGGGRRPAAASHMSEPLPRARAPCPHPLACHRPGSWPRARRASPKTPQAPRLTTWPPQGFWKRGCSAGPGSPAPRRAAAPWPCVPASRSSLFLPRLEGQSGGGAGARGGGRELAGVGHHAWGERALGGRQLGVPWQSCGTARTSVEALTTPCLQREAWPKKMHGRVGQTPAPHKKVQPRPFFRAQCSASSPLSLSSRPCEHRQPWLPPPVRAWRWAMGIGRPPP